jgi:NTE family protein
LQQNSILNLKMLTIRARQRHVKEFLVEAVGEKTFADLQIPVTLMAVDMRHGREICLSEGPLVPALLATSAVPGAFPPVRYQGMDLNDGGVIDSLATHVAFEQGADRVIAVDVYPELERENPWTDPISAVMGLDLTGSLLSGDNGGSGRVPSIVSSMWRSTRVMTWYVHQKRLAEHPPDILLRPDVDQFASLDFRDIDSPVQAGVEAADKVIPELRALVRVIEAG